MKLSGTVKRLAFFQFLVFWRRSYAALRISTDDQALRFVCPRAKQASFSMPGPPGDPRSNVVRTKNAAPDVAKPKRPSKKARELKSRTDH